MTPNALYDHTGRPVGLGKELGRGGEGRVLDVTTHPGTVAKIYLKPPTPAQAAKFSALVATSSPDLIKCAAWPTGTIHQNPGGSVVGLLMPKVVGHQEVHTLYSPAHRKHLFPDADWHFLVHTALNCAIAFDAVHRRGHVIGDVNQSNVLVRPTSATVFLIDCDSYQVSWNGRLFPCDVGVPQYTPPELQGQSFKGVARNANHDRFGLAVLIFHLLFMGRHPFVGRFLGRGEMPMDKAIKEYRFAFGRVCATVEMNPPPKSLPFSTLSADLIGLFERAFLKPTRQGVLRPTAAEWAQALAGLEKQLKVCTFDVGHKYPSHVAKCPWCDLMKSGAPNFFISVAIHRGVARSTFVLTVCWARIESIPPPREQYQRPSPPHQVRFVPKPLPVGVPEVVPPRIAVPRDFTQNVVGCVAIGAAVIFSFILLSMLSSVFLWFGMFGLVSCVTFGTWWLVLESMRKKSEAQVNYHRDREMRAVHGEYQVRYSAWTSWFAQLEKLEKRWNALAGQYAQGFTARKTQLEAVKTHYQSLYVQEKAERQALDQNRETDQRAEFLANHNLEDAEIDGIGAGLKATLRSYGIETADEIVDVDIMAVPGFGGVRTQKLLQWRHYVEMSFRFDPNSGIPKDRLAAIELKYAQLRQSCEMELQQGPEALQAIAADAIRQCGEVLKKIQDLLIPLAQTEADLSIIRLESE